LKVEKPKAVIFLGDTNTVTGAIAAAQLNIPIVHIEGCMRSYDWRMPEEKYRTIADHLSDVIYAYINQYKDQGIAEGIPSQNIVVTGNPIVDVLNEYFLSGKLRMNPEEFRILLDTKYRVLKNDFLLMTCHRRENVEHKSALLNILKLAQASSMKVVFPAGYRTQQMIANYELEVPANVILVDPIGYLELLELMMASRGVLTDSGTIVEEAAVLGIPSVQMRTATERPQVYECGASIKFDPFRENDFALVFSKLKDLHENNLEHPFGDGLSSYRIVDDLVSRLQEGTFEGHDPVRYRPFSINSYSSEI
jgi:UDP-N-acetylglucosamine 2-epimerase (non-hydrolysing)